MEAIESHNNINGEIDVRGGERKAIISVSVIILPFSLA